jgi:hypothetical protein
VLSNLHTLSLSAMPELVSLQANSLSNLPALQEFHAANNSKLSFIHASTFSRTVVSEDGQSRTTVWPPLEKVINRKIFFSNPRPSAYKVDALPTKLTRLAN